MNELCDRALEGSEMTEHTWRSKRSEMESGKKIHKIAEEDKIPLKQKLTFAAGVNTDFIINTLMTGFLWMPFFNIGLKVNVMLLTAVLVVYRLWDAISDPIVGNISDNARTRWGRRRPFMFVGAILCGLIFPFFWHMPSGLEGIGVFIEPAVAVFTDTTEFTMTEIGQSVYLVVLGIIFFTCFTVWSMSYYGLQLEMTPDYDERTRLTGWMSMFSQFSNLLGGWIIALISCSWFINEATGKPDLVVGMKAISWYLAAIIAIVGILPALFVKERYYEAEAVGQDKEPLWDSIKDSLRCGPLWILIIVSFLLTLGFLAVSNLSTYVNIYYVFDGDIAAASVLTGWRGTIMTVFCVITIPMWAYFGEKYDKRSMVIVMTAIGVLGHLANWLMMTPEMPYLQLFPAVLEACAMSAVWLFIPSMKADTADYDELYTHRRREGSINSFYSWFIKASGTCAMGVGGYVLSVSGFDPNLEVQSTNVVEYMFEMFVFIPTVIWFIAGGVMFFYSLRRENMDEIRIKLEVRRGKV